MSIDLEAYFARIHDTGDRAPTLPTLHRILARHVEHIPFENLDVLLGRPIELTPEAIERKLVHERRGGYCFEQNGLMAEVLHALGFDVELLSARVRIDRPRSMIPPRTHTFCRVELDGRSWLVDAGVGGLSLSSAIPLELDREHATPHEPRRILALGDWDGLLRRGPEAVLIHQARFGGEWHDVCEFTLEPMPIVDRVVANWFTSTHPQSHFRDRLMVARATPDGRITLLDRDLKFRGLDGHAEVQRIGSPATLRDLLVQHFGLTLPESALEALPLRWHAD